MSYPFKNAETLSIKDAEKLGVLQHIPISDIIEDPDNRPLFGEYMTDGLSSSISENGFQGAVLVYGLGDGRFMLQSGHRSVEASKRAGLTKVPAIITDAPRSEVERRKRLIIPNTHERDKNPMVMARMVQYHFETLSLEQEDLNNAGKNVKWNITEKVAKDLEISPSLVTKYRSLLKLTPKLQSLAEKRLVSWSELSCAATLPEELQEVVYRRILGESKVNGFDKITRLWIKREIEECKHIRLSSASYRYDPNDMSLYSEGLKSRLMAGRPDKKEVSAGRKRNSLLSIKKSEEYLERAFSERASYKDEDKALIVSRLKSLKNSIDDILSSL